MASALEHGEERNWTPKERHAARVLDTFFWKLGRVLAALALSLVAVRTRPYRAGRMPRAGTRARPAALRRAPRWARPPRRRAAAAACPARRPTRRSAAASLGRAVRPPSWPSAQHYSWGLASAANASELSRTSFQAQADFKCQEGFILAKWWDSECRPDPCSWGAMT